MKKQADRKSLVQKKPSTPEQRKEQRARRWLKTGVRQSTVDWMRKNGCL